VLSFVDMVAGYMEPYTTFAGSAHGVPAEAFLHALRAGLAPSAQAGPQAGRRA